jgi:catechol 2,3-dioxygenase-like lactoylglutathione lyase family enzyme
MPKIQGLSHMTFVCKDLEKTALLFKTLFDAQEIYSSDMKNFSLSQEKFFDIAGLWIAIMEGEPIEQTYNHVAFKINVEDLAAFGLTVRVNRKREAEEGESLYFYDYDNHLFELHTGDLSTRLAFYNYKPPVKLG